MQKVVLVTGAARRIGATIATYLHSQNYTVIIHCNNSVNFAMELANQLNKLRADSAKVIQCSLESQNSVENLVNLSLDWAGSLDVLVNNASVFIKDHDNFDEMLTINVKVPYWLSKAIFPYLKQNQGSIVNITDSNVHRPIKDYAIYCQTKAALSMQTKALAQEFAPFVRVNAVAPGAILWPEGDNFLNQAAKQYIISKSLLKRHGHPLNIAKAIFALIDNDFITGQELRVDGGRNI